MSSVSEPRNHVWQRRTDKVSEVIAREIVHEIVNRNLTPGTALPSEIEMLETYDVGRASLREALRILEVQGLIAIKPGRGGGPVFSGVEARNFARMATLYFHVARATYQDLIDARQVIEPMIARLVASRADSTVIGALEESLDSTRAAVRAEDSRQYVAATSSFHAVLLALGNPIIDVFGDALRSIFVDRVSSSVFPPDHRARVLASHESITDAIRTGDAERAEELTREHLEEYSKQLDRRYPGLLSEIVDWR